MSKNSKKFETLKLYNPLPVHDNHDPKDEKRKKKLDHNNRVHDLQEFKSIPEVPYSGGKEKILINNNSMW